jgi:hypothetical protein
MESMVAKKGCALVIRSPTSPKLRSSLHRFACYQVTPPPLALGSATSHLHAMIVVGSPRIDVALARGRPPGAIPRLAAIREVHVLDQFQIRPPAVLTALDVAAALAVQIPVLADEIGHVVVVHVGPHVVVPAPVQLHGGVGPHDVVEVRGQALHGHGPDHAAVPHPPPAVLAREAAYVVPLAYYLQVLVVDPPVGLQDYEARLEGCTRDGERRGGRTEDEITGRVFAPRDLKIDAS